MNRFISIIICAFVLMGMAGCTKKKESTDLKTNGEIKEILEENGWISKCSSEACYVDNGKTKLYKYDDFTDIKKETSLTANDLNGFLVWMENRKDNNFLTDNEWASEQDKKIANENKSKNEITNETTNETTNKGNENKEKENASNSDEQTVSSDKQESISLGKSNALNRAKAYLNTMPFSYSGLIEQLKYENYTDEEATYAADNCGADWNEQAAKKAQNYLDTMAFSRQGLIDQLIYEGFTQAQAEYGVSQVGY